MAEATLTEAETTPPEEAAVATPESAPESVPAPENADDSSRKELVSSIVSAFTEDGDKDGSNAAPDAVVPPAGPTPQQIEAQVRNQVANENRLIGLRNTLMDQGPAALMKFRPQYEGDEQREFDYIINTMKGAAKPLVDRAVDVDTNYAPQVRLAAHKEAEDFTLGKLTDVIRQTLGEAEAEAFSKAGHKSWEDVGTYTIKAARKGYVSVETATKKLNETIAKYDQVLGERAALGIVTNSLAELRGSTGPETPTAGGGNGKGYTLDQIEAMPTSKWMEFDKPTRERLLAQAHAKANR